MITKLTETQIEDFIKDLLAGLTPADLAPKYDISIPSIHNYKRILAEERALTFPSVVGKRPNKKVEVAPVQTQTQTQSQELFTSSIVLDLNEYNVFTMNGQRIYVPISLSSIYSIEDGIVIKAH